MTLVINLLLKLGNEVASTTSQGKEFQSDIYLLKKENLK